MFSKRICPLTSPWLVFLPSSDSASTSGMESSSLMISDPAPLAVEMSGTKENTFPALMAPKVVLYKSDPTIRNSYRREQEQGRTIRPMKNWNVETSNVETKRDPYQNTSAMTNIRSPAKFFKKSDSVIKYGTSASQKLAPIWNDLLQKVKCFSDLMEFVSEVRYLNPLPVK